MRPIIRGVHCMSAAYITNTGGHGSYGLVVKRDGQTTHSEGAYIGHGAHITNNVSEYCGAVAALTFLVKQGITSATIFGDSQLVIRQLNGSMKARAGAYLPYHRTARDLRAKLPNEQMVWIPRARNAEADALASEALRSHLPANHAPVRL